MEVTGILKVKSETQKVSEKFSKREFVLTTEASTPYPQHVQFQLTQDKCALLDGYSIGEEMKIQFNLRGREWNGPEGTKYFNTLEAWKLEKTSGVSTSAPAASKPAAAKTNVQAQPSAPASDVIIGSDTFSGSDNDDMPF